jgi:hypothetical protein
MLYITWYSCNIHKYSKVQLTNKGFLNTNSGITYLLTYSLEQSPSWEADKSLQLTKKFPAFYGTRRFFTILTSARHPSLSRANSIQSPRPPPSHLRLGLPNGLFPSGFPTNTLWTPLSSPIRANSGITLQLMWTARMAEAKWRQVLQGRVGMGTKADESSTAHVWAAGFHHVTACYHLAHFETYELFL